jgi:hypothetical protein
MPMNAEVQDRWHVRLWSGEVRACTLDELDAGFQAGSIGEDTFVLAPGSTTWAKLADVAGLSADEAPPPSSSSAPLHATGPNSLAPFVADVSMLANPLSHVDVSDLDPESFRPKGRKAIVVGVLGGFGALLAGVAFLISQAQTTPETSTATASQVANTELVGASDDVGKDSYLTDDQKRALLEADRARAEKIHKSRVLQQSQQSHSIRRAPSGPVFHAGGDPHDPLNSSL